MIYLGPVLVLLVFLVALLLLFVLAFRSLRYSWYLSLGCLAVTGFIATYLTAQHAATTDRLQRLMRSLTMPTGQPLIINPTTSLLEVAARDGALIYMYETADRKTLPTRADAIQQNCMAPGIRAALELGARVEHQYKAGTTEVLRITLHREDCL